MTPLTLCHVASCDEVVTDVVAVEVRKGEWEGWGLCRRHALDRLRSEQERAARKGARR